jgi:hypothetical protein
MVYVCLKNDTRPSITNSSALFEDCKAPTTRRLFL